MKIAVLTRVFAPTGGGAERYSMAVVEHLSASHEIHVFAQEIDHQLPNVRYHRVGRPFTRPRWLNQLWYALVTWGRTRRGYDIVHSHENVWHGNVQTMHVKTTRRSRFGNKKGWALSLRILTTAFSARLMTYLLLERARVTKHAGCAVVAVSESLREELAEEYPKSRPVLHVISPGVYLPDHTVSQLQARKLVGVEKDGIYLVFVARDYVRKGLGTLFLAFQNTDSWIKLLVVGNTNEIPRFRAEAEALGIGSRVYFLGALTSATLVYQAADILVHPTLEDSFGMVVFEAMACRLPVIVSNHEYCGASSLLTDHVHAILLKDPQNVTELYESIMSIVCSPELAERLRENGFSLAKKHSWQAAASGYQEIYSQICSGTLN